MQEQYYEYNKTTSTVAPYRNTKLNFETSLSFWTIYSFIELFIGSMVLLVTILASFSIAYCALFKFGRTRTNKYIIHYGIANVIVFFGIPIFEWVLYYLGSFEQNVDFFSSCLTYKAEKFTSSLPFAFGFFLGVDYVIISFYGKLNQYCVPIQNFLIFIIYFFYLNGYVILKTACYQKNDISYPRMESMLCGTCVILQFLQNVLVRYLSLQDRGYDFHQQGYQLGLIYSWKLSNFIVYSWIQTFIVYLCFGFSNSKGTPQDFSSAIENILLAIFRYNPPIIVALWMFTTKDDIVRAVRGLFRAIRRKLNPRNQAGWNAMEWELPPTQTCV